MNEEERAEWLARAIDDLMHKDRQRPKEPPPPKLDREELNALLRIASSRAEAADSRLHSGLQYEGEVWQRVLKRLDRRQFPRDVKSFDAPASVSELDEFVAGRELEQMEIDELREIARMRREMAERAASLRRRAPRRRLATRSGPARGQRPDEVPFSPAKGRPRPACRGARPHGRRRGRRRYRR